MQWNVIEQPPTLPSEVQSVHPLVLRILAQRGIASEKDISAFLNPQYEALHDPFLFAQMRHCIDRLKKARQNQEHICVYGDYDADGVCSTVLLAAALREAGFLHVFIYIPHREQEGYGLNTSAIDYLSQKNVRLLIAVDCATSNVLEVAYAREKQMDVMILDHHAEPEVLPKDVTAFLNPHLSAESYPFKNLAAVGVVFKVVQAIWHSFGLKPGHEKWLLDLVATATVADMMDLVGENRIFVHFGLQVMNKGRRAGFRALRQSAQLREITAHDIGFKIAPRLNAAGRIDHANTAYALLATDDMAEALSIAGILENTNSVRQAETERIVKEAYTHMLKNIDTRIVHAALGADWAPGVVGLASSRLTERLYRPTLVLTQLQGKIIGSGRSIPGFNITAALSENKQYLEKFGGHEGACGFTLASANVYDAFVAGMNESAHKILSKEQLIKMLRIDAVIRLPEIDWDMVSALSELAPFGMGNPKPVCASLGVRIVKKTLMGKDENHMRLALEQDSAQYNAVAFSVSDELKQLSEGDIIDVAYDIDVNEWKGARSIQLKIKDIKRP